MYKNWKSVLILLLTVAVVLGAGAFPVLFFRIQDYRLNTAAFPRQEVFTKLDPQAEEIYLVGAVREIYESGQRAYYPDTSELLNQTFDTFQGQLKEMKADGVLQGNHLEQVINKEYSELLIDQLTLVTSTQRKEDKSLGYYVPFDDIKAIDPFVGFRMEPKTQKLIFLQILFYHTVLEESTGSSGTTSPSTESLDHTAREELLQAYIRYLGLDILDDWTYNELGAVSRKAQLQIVYRIHNDSFILYVIPTGYYLLTPFYDSYNRTTDGDAAVEFRSYQQYINEMFGLPMQGAY